MKIAIRNGVFETNSSSTHSLALVRTGEKAPDDMEVSFEVVSPVAKVFMLFGFVENAEYEYVDGESRARELVLRFKAAALQVLSERLGVTPEAAMDEVECEAFGNRILKDALGDEEKLRALLASNKTISAEFKASGCGDLLKFAREYYAEDLEKCKSMMEGKYRCDSYFCNGCLIECNCGFESYSAMVQKFKLNCYDTDEILSEKAREFLSDDVRILCEEFNAGIIPMTTGEEY